MGYNEDMLKDNLEKYNELVYKFIKREECENKTPVFLFLSVMHDDSEATNNQVVEETPCEKSKLLSINEYKKIAKTIGTIYKVVFVGGESFLREDFPEIVSLFQNDPELYEISAITQGQATGEILTNLEKILRTNPGKYFSLGFVLDGYEEYHDAFHGQGTYKQCLETWNECKKRFKYFMNFEMYICCTINKENARILPEYIYWCVEALKPNKFSFICDTNNTDEQDFMKYYKQIMVSLENVCKSGKVGNPNYPRTYSSLSICRYVYETLQGGQRSYKCYAGVNSGYIDCYGNVGLCNSISSLGNLSEVDYNFLVLWKREQARRELAGTCKECSMCTNEICGIFPSMFMPINGVEL